MPRSIPPPRWAKYVALLRDGWPRSEAARQAGISKEAVASFHRGDPSSSGVRWLAAQRAADDLDLIGATPTKGNP